MKAADGGKRGGRRQAAPSASPSGQRPHAKRNFYNPMSRLDSNQMEVRPPGHPDHHRRGKPL